LTRIAKQPAKIAFAVRTAIATISIVSYLIRREDQIDLYETLQYRLKR
jgi:hypothetical protein